MHVKPYFCGTNKKHNYIMPKILQTTIPYEFAACQHSDCPLSDTCLRQVAYKQLLNETDNFRIVNPSQCSKDDVCRYFRTKELVRYARGFTALQEHMYPGQYKLFKSALIRRFSRSTYFERRRGTRAMPPEEQALVLRTLRNVGVNENIDFDGYEEGINWYN